ncbi:MAG: ATP-binding protein [Lachnospiraceae bacterium]|nr:ATP-binding protein [Lachnospiraceae bacterium]MBP3506248.1 ATP-binding protein [Lachnospiraceae bacterium]
MYFRRKAYDKLLEWKSKYADQYSILLEGARRVGKSTIAEQFAINEYESYILIDFANVSDTIISCFDDVYDLDLFFLRLQAATGVTLVLHKSVIIFDEIQLFPKARQAIKYLVKDGRYHYIETGSLISIKKNVKGILIPSEEKKISIYPMDYEEFMWATGNNNYELLRKLYESKKEVGQQINRKLMRDFRIYMAVGGMPQAVQAYVEGKNFSEIDKVKRTILSLYEEDFKKIDSSGRITSMFHSIPTQLCKDTKKYSLSEATGKRKSKKDEELLYDLIDSKTVLVSYNSTDPRVSISMTKDLRSYKMYICDTGLFVTLLFMDRPEVESNIYSKLLSDKLPANLGYLYENAVAQVLASMDRELYYHTWKKPYSTHYYEIDFLVSNKDKVSVIEVKSSGTGKHESILKFREKYSKNIKDAYVLSQKDVSKKEGIDFLPIYMAPFIVTQR